MGRLTAEDRKSNNTLHMALTVGLMLITMVFYCLVNSTGNQVYETKTIFFILASVLSLICLMLSAKVYTTNIKAAASKQWKSYEEASANFRAANVARWSLIEGIGLMSVVLAYLEKNVLIFIPVLVSVLFLFVSKMNEEHFNNYKYD